MAVLKTIRELHGVVEDDTVESFSYRTTYVIQGYTRQELYDAAAWPSPEPDIEDLRTGYLAKKALVATIPAYVGEAPLTKVTSIEEDELENVFRYEVEYSAGGAAAPAANEETQPDGSASPALPKPSIRIATQTVNVQVARGPIRVYKKTGGPTVAAPRGILPDGKGNFRGADVVVPSLSWSEPHVVAANNFSLAKGLALVGKVNLLAFRGFAPKTVLCLGASADQRPEDGFWDVVVEFQYSPPLSNETAPGFSDYENVTKDGYEFLFPLTDSAGAVTALAVAPLYESVDYGLIVPSLGSV
jgi:hypothetical protein